MEAPTPGGLRWWLGAIAMTLALGAPASGAAPLSLALADDAVTVGGVEGGAEVVCFIVYRFSDGFVPRTERRAERVADADGDGAVRIELRRRPPPKFLAVAVELGSGRFAAVTAEGSPARRIALPAGALAEDRRDRLVDGEATAPAGRGRSRR